ncbi:MAG: putative sensor protein [Pedosphaera sp.]|nr:putative sensor protein [Pedosphaera sp.]
MNRVLRVLVVEDSENDAKLMLLKLRQGGYEPEHERVDTAAAMEAALQRREWDIIICDYVMPGFSGLDALSLFKQKGLDIPFIVFSGHIGEAIAVQAMRAGAHDYIMKDNMARLVPAVTRELREAGIRKARRESEQALRESEERFRQLADNLDAAFFVSERSGGEGSRRMLYVSPAYETIWGRSMESLYQDGMSWLKAVHPEDEGAVLCELARMDRGEFDLEFRIRSLDMKTRWIHYRTFPVFNANGDMYRIAGIAEDITRHKQTEEQLAANAKQLGEMVEEMRAIGEELRERNREILESRADLEKRVHERTMDLTTANAELKCQMNERTRLERELLEIAEKERRRIGFDLHDDLSQKLMGVSFMIKALERKVANKHLPKVKETRKIQTLINQVINHTRDLAHDFSSLDLQGDNLALELKGLASNVRKMFQISCRFSSKGTLPRLQPNITVQLYKISQEAVSNAVKHGKAKLVSISLTSVSGKLILVIRNNGLPFPVSKTDKTGVGLRIMNSRAGIIGGSLAIRSQGDNGTIVTCTLPLVEGPKVTQVDFGPKKPAVSHANGENGFITGCARDPVGNRTELPSRRVEAVEGDFSLNGANGRD